MTILRLLLVKNIGCQLAHMSCEIPGYCPLSSSDSCFVGIETTFCLCCLVYPITPEVASKSFTWD